MNMYNQHYVPRSILQNFTSSNTVFCLMKEDGKIINSTVKNLCAERDFYSFSLDIEDEGTDRTLDYDKKVFDEVDNQIAPIAKKIINHHSVDILTSSERENLSKYVVYQYFRSPAARGVARLLSTNETGARQTQGSNLLDNEYIKRISDIINNLILKLIKSNESNKFIISDSPVLWSPTAEAIYFPISPEFCLCYQEADIVPLDYICINELEFLASIKFNIAQNKNTLENIWQQIGREHINKFCNTGNHSYWKCVLETQNSLSCIETFKESIYKEFKGLIS